MNTKTRFKKSAGLLMSLVCAGAMIGSSGMTTFADAYEADSVTFATATNNPYDVDGDGILSASDYICITDYLAGKRSAVGYNRLDVNQDLIINQEDAKCVWNMLLGKASSTKFISEDDSTVSYKPSNIVSPATLDFSADGTADGIENNLLGVKYKKCTYDHDFSNLISSYTLAPSDVPISSNSTASPDGIVGGSDDRYRTKNQFKNTGIVRFSNNDDKDGVGFIVGDHMIATAASNVYDKGNNTFYDRNSLRMTTYNEAGHSVGKYVYPYEVHIPDKYTTTENVAYDYALIVVETDLSDYYHFDLGSYYNMNSDDFKKIPIHITGAPDTVNVDGKETSTVGYLYTGEGASSIPGSSVLYCNADASKEENGAPMYVISQITVGGATYEQATAIGIYHHENSTSYSRGTRITKYQLQLFYGNSNAATFGSKTGTVTE